MYQSAYTYNYYDPVTGYLRYVRIDEKPPARTREKSTLLAGDLVVWKPDVGTDFNRRPYYMNKVIGTVVESRWTLMDWDASPHERTRENSEYYPEAVVMWNDGETTNTSQNCLDKVTEDTHERQETHKRLRRLRGEAKIPGRAKK